MYKSLLLSSVLVALLLSAIYLFNPKVIQFPTLKSTDIILGTATAPAPDPAIVLVAIDEASLLKYGQWPWPRYRLARLFKTMVDGGAASVGIDIIFPERDRTSPILWQENLENDFGYTVDTSAIPEEILDHDIYLANTLKEGPFIMGYKFLFNAKSVTEGGDNLHPVSLSLKGLKDNIPDLNFYQAEGVISNYRVLAEAVDGCGFLNGNPDVDGVLRRLPLLISFDQKLYPSFALSILMQFKNQHQLVLQKDAAHITRLSVADRHIPTDDQGNFLLGPANNVQSERLSAVDVLEGKTGSDSFRDKIVLVGLTASGFTQMYPTPHSSASSLLDIHKQSIESLLSGIQTIRTPRFLVFEALLSVFLCFALALCIASLSTLWSAGFCLLAVVLSWGAAGAVYQQSGFLFSPFLPTMSLIVSYFLLVTLKFRHFQLRAKRETEEAMVLLKSSESHLQSILSTIPDIVFRLDRNGKIIFISPAITKYGMTSESLLDHSIFELVDPEDLEKARFSLVERRTGERATLDIEIRLRLFKKHDQSNENRRFFSISAEGIYQVDRTDRKRFVGTQGIVRDITKRKRLEYQLVQAQKMEVVGNLAAGIAHDLNNILSGLVSYPQLLLMDIPKDNPLYDKVCMIQKSGQKAAVIVQDLLTLARRSITIIDVCNLNTIVSEYLESVEFERIKKGYSKVTIHTELKDDLLNVKGSAVHLSKALMNILHNALEAMPAGGAVVIKTFDTYIDTHLYGYERIPEGEYSCLSISDTGVGIPKTGLKRIFEPFYTKKMMAGGGTGLGMTIIWATVKDHKGYIDIQSEEGRGTTLEMYLPTTRDKQGALQRRIVLDDYIGSETILVIDDIPEQLDIARTMLEKLGYTVFTALSGEKALESIKKQSVDLVILDMIMPGGLDGLETYQEIVQRYPRQKAIITSGFSQSEGVKELLSLGVGGYVQKPYAMETLGMAVRKELDRTTG